MRTNRIPRREHPSTAFGDWPPPETAVAGGRPRSRVSCIAMYPPEKKSRRAFGILGVAPNLRCEGRGGMVHRRNVGRRAAPLPSAG